MEKGITFDPKNLEVLAYLSGEPNCKHCYGKGYLSISLAGLVYRCRCAVIREPMTTKIIQNQIKLAEDFKALQETFDKLTRELHANIDVTPGDILKRLDVIESRFIRTKIFRLFRRKTL